MIHRVLSVGEGCISWWFFESFFFACKFFSFRLASFFKFLFPTLEVQQTLFLQLRELVWERKLCLCLKCMDNAHQYFTANFASNRSKSLSKVVDDGDGYSVITALQLNSPVSSPSFSNSRGSKRKWSTVNGSVNLRDGSSLALGLGCSASSCTSISSGKDIGVESDLNISLLLGNGRTHGPRNVSHGTSMALEVSRPKLDLELSLSTGAAESDVSSVSEAVPFQNRAEAPVAAGKVQLVDEGSTSSRWKLGSLLHPSQRAETCASFDQAHSHINSISVIPNLSSTATIMPKNSVASASGVVHQQQQQQPQNNSVKTCRFQGCTRGARGASGLCISHGGGRRCQRAGCQKGAEGKTVFCKAHGGGRRCQHLGCTKSAEGHTDYCIGHGGGRRCSHEGCLRAARGKSGLCIRHGGGKRCKMENCTKSAEGISALCISHGGGRRCQYPDCTKGAQGSTMFCKAHGGGKRCTFIGCAKGAEGSTPFCKGHGGGKRCTFEGGCNKSVHGGTLFCVNHGGGKRCAMPGCTKSARGRTDFCVRHGGGKRCKFEGCTKSAQGSTDFCKAHGGGKRCSWGLLGSEFGAQAAACDKFARGKSGLCAAHSAQLQDKQIHDGQTLQDPESGLFEKMKGSDAATRKNHSDSMTYSGVGGTSVDSMGLGHPLISVNVPMQGNFSVGNHSVSQFSLPEGRVHGGSLMAMLRGSGSIGPGSSDQVVGGPSEQGKSCSIPRSWL